MKKKNYILKIENPCDQEWASMTETNIGKFCSSCSKSVVDFTRMTDSEIVQIIEQNSGKLCGRLTKGQLNKPIQLNQSTKNTRMFQIITGFLLIGACENLSATDNQKYQQDLISIAEDYNKKEKTTELKLEPIDSLKYVVHGLVTESETKEGLAFAYVKMKDTKIATTTDEKGYFKLIIPDSLIKDQIHLVIQYVGFENTEIVINKSEFPVYKEIVMVPGPMMIGAIEIETKRRWWRKNKKNQ